MSFTCDFKREYAAVCLIVLPLPHFFSSDLVFWELVGYFQRGEFDQSFRKTDHVPKWGTTFSSIPYGPLSFWAIKPLLGGK